MLTEDFGYQAGSTRVITLPPGEYFGEALGVARLGDVVLTELAYSPSAKLSEHAHSRAFFALVLEGGYSERTGSGRRECFAGTVLFHPAGGVHCEEFVTTPSRTFNVELNPRWFARFDGCPIAFDRQRLCQRGFPAWILVRLYREFRERDALSGLVAEALAVELTAELLARDVPQPDASRPLWLQRVLEYLHVNWGESMTLTRLAEVAGVHPTHLTRTFRRWLQCTPGEYVRRQQVEYVRRALIDTAAPISEIAAAAGFFDQSHLCRVFKKLQGITPARYRALARWR